MVRRFFQRLRAPSGASLGALLLGGVMMGAGALLAFDASMDATSTDAFCLSCHELEVNIGREYEGMSHASNAVGMRVACRDCHLPEPFAPKMARKMRAVAEVYHHVIGTIDTPEKFEAHRMTMATRVWDEMNENDSRECRACHKAGLWDLAAQSERAQEFHVGPLVRGKTCISCHKGVAHKLPEGIVPGSNITGGPPHMDPTP